MLAIEDNMAITAPTDPEAALLVDDIDLLQ